MWQSRLKDGDTVRSFEIADMRGRRVELTGQPGRHVLLSFYRYASCPLCNLRVHELSGRCGAWQEQGLDLLAVFQSPQDKLRHYVGQQQTPFPLIPDPEQRLYNSMAWATVGADSSRPGSCACLKSAAQYSGRDFCRAAWKAVSTVSRLTFWSVQTGQSPWRITDAISATICRWSASSAICRKGCENVPAARC